MVRSSPFLLAGLIPLLLSCAETGSGSLAPEIEDPHFSVESRYPAPGRLGVDVDAWVSVRFSSLIDPTTATAGAITLNGGIPGQVQVDGYSVRFIPSQPLDSGSPYEIAISPSIRGSNGLFLGPTPTWGFKTAGATPTPRDTTIVYGPRPGDAGSGPR